MSPFKFPGLCPYSVKIFFITTDTSIYSKGHPEMVIAISNEWTSVHHIVKRNYPQNQGIWKLNFHTVMGFYAAEKWVAIGNNSMRCFTWTCLNYMYNKNLPLFTLLVWVYNFPAALFPLLFFSAILWLTPSGEEFQYFLWFSRMWVRWCCCMNLLKAA